MDLSIVIPTFNEADNILELVRRIEICLGYTGYSYEICFIDDSTDNTPQILAEVAAFHPQVRYVHRTTVRGLGTAVVEGFRRATGENIVVMDADLQHPPELLPKIMQLLGKGTDIVIPSRFVPGGSDGGLNALRKFVSWTARTIARTSIQKLRNISDCTSGFFGLRKCVVEGVDLDPIGWKILIEVLVKGKYARVHEIPYGFESRTAGESKMSLREQWNFLHHIAKLVRQSPEDRRFYLFCGVGALGVIVNMLVMGMCVRVFHLPPVGSSVIASLIAMAHNFLWNDRVTWRDSSSPVMWRRTLKFPIFVLISTIGVLVTAVSVQLFLGFHGDELIGQLCGIICATVWNFKANNRWTWREINTRSSHRVVVTRE
ncbi:glycosyltransferase [Alicyclobacillus kakegawensis]|uniref:glycosyltransferase n=1 Tax=Alicyclobacillus kakegawensis TaxID=392012 RepID=UPI000831BD35|nr:glycosyltransferase family 2 protein [Alicyclobacillus kakegawensis]